MKTKRALKKGERRVGGVSGGVGAHCTGHIYKFTRRGRGRGKYERNLEDRIRARVRLQGKTSLLFRFTEDDDKLQRAEMKKMVKVTQEDVLAGKIPKLSSMMAYARDKLEKSPEYQSLKKDNAKLQKILAINNMAVAEYAMSLWEHLPKKERTARKFYSYFVKSYKDLTEETRKAIDSANEIEFGKEVTINKKGSFEDDLEKLDVVDVTPEKIDDGNGKEEPNKSV